ncbi:MAG TPA: hypothetical protein VF303_02870 [Candidatus Nanoarchaeia archaeon]
MTITIHNIIKGIIGIQILQIDYWFRSKPDTLQGVLLPTIVFFLIFLVGFILIIYNQRGIGYYPPKNRIFKPAGIGLIIMGLAGAAFTFFTWQGVSFLGVRAFLLVIFLASVAWASYSLYLYRKKVPEQVVRYEASLIKQKYFSKKKI